MENRESTERSSSLDHSCVSLKSDVSMHYPPNLNDEPVTSDPSILNQRSSSADPSCLSLKSDRSVEQPPKFSDEAVTPDLSLPSQFSTLCSEDQEDTETFVMATADKLLKLILCWIEEKERFADNLMKLAEELESLRAKCNVGECVGSTVTVVGAAGMIGAGVATLLTGGAGLPLFQLATQVTQIGSGISHVTKIIEELHNSKTMKKVKDVEEKSNIIAEEIQQLFQKLKSEKKEANPLLNPDELEHQIMAEFLRAIVRQSGLNVQIINDSMLNGMLSRTLLEYPLETFSDEHSRRSGGGFLVSRDQTTIRIRINIRRGF
ncbi:hypothetical protein Q8A67_000142 [Cirrhinus molitorella]|uniref:Apolipoprotein L3 n=1 Tax=Cirrhinus molitorella TaxID=172907 RepID=A0AA88QEY2_9TELE|nr:hypothetical protein Q8A67_000142 [Cirrhinus molitorella]